MKKLFICAAVIAAAAFGVMKATETNVTNKMSDLQMENVELLAEGEGYNDHSNCRWNYNKDRCAHSGFEVCLLTDRTFWGCREW